ncbi:MAG: transcriptional repressor LexA [Chthoniobacterales bacterium]
MSSKVTARQQQVLDYIGRHRERHGLPPTVREIQAHFGFASPNAAASHLRALERKKLVQRGPGAARALQVTGDDRKEVSAIPVYGDIPAGFPDTREQRPDGCIYADLDSLDVRRTARTFAVRVRGDSMIGAHILDGDLVVLELREPNHGNIVAALIDGETTLKRYLVKNRRPFLRAENPKYPDLIPAHELVIQGVMIALFRKPKDAGRPIEP